MLHIYFYFPVIIVTYFFSDERKRLHNENAEHSCVAYENFIPILSDDIHRHIDTGNFY